MLHFLYRCYTFCTIVTLELLSANHNRVICSCVLLVPLTEPRERPTHHSRHAGIAAPSRKGSGTIRDMDRLRVNGEGLGTHREFDYKYHDHGQDRDRPRVTGERPGPHRERDNRHYDHGAVRDKDWGSGDFERAGKSRKPRQDREKHVRINSRPVNRHEPHGGL